MNETGEVERSRIESAIDWRKVVATFKVFQKKSPSVKPAEDNPSTNDHSVPEGSS